VYYNVSREVNYEVNQTSTQIEEAQGQIESLSVSVILNSSNIDDYVDEVKTLVATAIGADAEKITVQMLPFEAAAAEAEQDAAEVSAAQQVEQQIASSAQGAQTLRLVIVVIAGLVAVIMLFAIIKMFKPQKAEAVGVGGGGFDVMVGDEPRPASSFSAVSGSTIDDMEIDFNNKDSKLSALEDYIGKNPESAANLLRNWLNEE
jgi:flagellar biosynthesis/type III secretory pathway M-ring protein FliF/YscJ